MPFEFEDTKPNIANEKLLADLCRVAALLGTTILTQRAYRGAGRYSTTAIEKRFGKWKTAVNTAGLEAGSEQDIPVNELFDNLREVWMKLGRQPRKREMTSTHSQFTHHPYVRRFGGWLNAMRAFTRSINEAEADVGTLKRRATQENRAARTIFASPVSGHATRPFQVCPLRTNTSD